MGGCYRYTKIIATVGPATESEEMLEKLIVAGLDVMRLNMAHGTSEWVTSLVKRIRDVSARVHRDVAVMMDVKGPEMRTGVVTDAIDLQEGDPFELYTQGPTTDLRGIDVNYAGLARDIAVGATVLVDSGLIRMEVVEKNDDATTMRLTGLEKNAKISPDDFNQKLDGVRIVKS